MKNKNSKNVSKKLFYSFKGKIAIFLILSMLLTMVLPHISILSFDAPNLTYASELKPETLNAEDNESNTTVSYWKSNSVIDFQIKLNPNYHYVNDSEYSDSKITYRNNGFALKCLVTTSPIDPYSTTNPESREGDTASFSGGNGGIYINNDVELKLKTYHSSDKRFVIYELQAYNNSADKKFVSLRFHADTQMTNNDYARVLLNPDDQLMHLVNDNSGSSDFTSFDIISTDSSIKLNPFNVAYATYYSSRNNRPNCWKEYYTDQTGTSYDSGISLGWRNIELQKYQVITRRVAVLTRTTTFYVNSLTGNDFAGVVNNIQPGAFDNPFRTVGRAIMSLQGRKGYICIQNDCDLIGSDGNPLQLNINNANTDITIQSTDINVTGRKNFKKFKLNCASNSNINISNGYLTFQDIELVGKEEQRKPIDRTRELIRQTGGSLSFSSGTVISTFSNTKGAAVLHTTENGKLGIYGAEVANCISSDYHYTDTNNKPATKSTCAISFEGMTGTDSAYGFEMNGNNQIYDNFDKDGNKRNIYLADGKFIQVSNLLKNDVTGIESNISVTTEKSPDAYIGAVRQESEEVLVAKPTSEYPNYTGLNNCPFEQLFHDDRTKANNRIGIVEGKYTGGSTPKKNAVVTQLGSRITFKYVNENGTTLKGLSRENLILPIGLETEIKATPSVLTGYELDRCQVTGNGWTVNNDKTDSKFGTAKGTVGTTNVEIRYIFKPKEVAFEFLTRGGSPENIPNVTGQVSKRVSAIMPKLTKYGYIFAGWYDNIDDPLDTSDVGKITSLPTYFPTESTKYHAKYNIDPNIFIPITEGHTNADGSIVFYETPESSIITKNVETNITEFSSKEIPGYVANAVISYVTPATYFYRDVEGPVGTFTDNATTTVSQHRVDFSGRTPGQQTLLSFKYDVDPNQHFTLRSEYVKVDSRGLNPQPLNINGATYEELSLNAEEVINYTPPARNGFNVIGAEITAGQDDVDAEYKKGITGSFDQYTSYTFNGNMTNQNVTIKYTYQSTANDKEFIVDYTDEDTLDNRNKYIVASDVSEHSYEDNLSASKVTEYGYNYFDKSVTPTTAGSFDGNDNFTGTMPLDEPVNVI